VVDYAVLPFVWEGGSSTDFLALNGVTANGLGNDYASGNAPYLIKFDGTGDYIQVKTDSQPGKVTINVKMIGGSNTSTITIQGSADGENFTDIEELTISGEQNDVLTLETTNDFGGNDRYVRMLFTKGSNVGVGPITITKGTSPSITVAPASFELDAVGPLNGMALPTSIITYHNFEITQASDFYVQYYNAEGEEQERPEWIGTTQVGGPMEGDGSYQVISIITANEGPARSAYFKVYAYDADSNPVYSNLVTYNQAGVDYATLPFEFNGGKTDIENTIGLTYEGLGSDYGSSPKLKFDGTGDWLILKLNEAPLSLSYDIKGNGFSQGSTSTFNVMVSADGVDYETLATYTELGATQTITYIDLASTVRYIKWVYTEKGGTSGGNVALGNIHVSANYDIYGNITVESLTIPAGKTCTVYNGAALNVTETLTNGATENAWEHLVIKDGAQLKTPNEVKGTVEKNITGYSSYDGNGNGGYYLIASPADGQVGNFTNFRPETAQMNEVDWYMFNQQGDNAGNEWINQKHDGEFFGQAEMLRGKGYLYAREYDVTISFVASSMTNPSTTTTTQVYFGPTNVPYNVPEIELGYTGNATWAGWNLVGNPFTCNAYLNRTYFRMNAAGDAIIEGTGTIKPCEGVFVVVTDEDKDVTFSATEPNAVSSRLSININGNGMLMDRASLHFDESNSIKKYVLTENATRVYIPQGNQDYAVVRSNAQGEMPVNFKAGKNGTYTLSINPENVEMNYLHLIDNITGADVDLLAEPSYSFEARTSDYASRFRLVFSANSNVEDNSEASFAYYNGSEWVLNNMGNATLQVIDITGRVLSSETISGNASISLNQTPGVYMLRLINSDSVRTQKIVVK